MGSLFSLLEYFWLYGVNLGMADCTNFVSQALVAGGISMNDDWHYYYSVNNPLIMLGVQGMYITQDGMVTHRPYNYDFTPTWSMASQQFAYFSNPDNGYINGDVITINDISEIPYVAMNMGVQPGDLLYFAGNNGVHHATIITQVDNDEIYYAAHTANWQYRELSLGLRNQTAYIVRIK